MAFERPGIFLPDSGVCGSHLTHYGVGDGKRMPCHFSELLAFAELLGDAGSHRVRLQLRF